LLPDADFWLIAAESQTAQPHAVCSAGAMKVLVRNLTEICADLWYHGDLPGYQACPWRTRCLLNLHALADMLLSAEFLRLTLYLILWLLAGFHLVWHFDLHGTAATFPLLSASLWLFPWFAAARRRRIHARLGGRWPLR
jgi:hypothetical protein